ELVGRSPYPGDEDPAFAGASDLRALRGILAKRGASVHEIEQQCQRILADRAAAFGELIDALYARHGRIDGVIHGAGVLEDKLIRHKTGESFERVFATKMTGAPTLVERLRDDVKVVGMFS